MTTSMSKIGFHEGEALIKLAGNYPTIQGVIFEAVQNALDAGALNIDININYQTQTLSVCDDGEGTSPEKFEEKLALVCHSNKDAGKLGQFGIGLIAPLGKCEKYTFTSIAKGDNGSYRQWAFVTEDIKKQVTIKGIPMSEIPGMAFNPFSGGTNCYSWRTQVRMINFVKDRIISKATIASLREGILEKFSRSMVKNNTQVRVEIIPESGPTQKGRFLAEKFAGQKLPLFEVAEKNAGYVACELFIANKGVAGRKGKVMVGVFGKDFRIALPQLAGSLAPYVNEKVLQCLCSGLFEGEIVAAKIQLHPDRRHFQEDDALVGLGAVLEKWFERVGKEYMEKIQEEAKDQRYQNLGLRSMKVMEAILKRFKSLQDVINSFRFGAKASKKDALPMASNQGEFLGKHDPKGKHGSDQDPITGANKNMVEGPKGKSRASAKGKNLGLQFFYDEMEGSEKLWELDMNRGELHFNTRHPLWAQCEQDEKTLMRFQEYIAMHALFGETIPEQWREQQVQLSGEFMSFVAFWLCNGDAIAGRKPGRPRSEPVVSGWQ